MNIKKTSYLSIVLCTFFLTTNPVMGISKENIAKSIAAGALAFAGYYGSEIFTALIHELGHATAFKLTNGTFPHISVSGPGKASTIGIGKSNPFIITAGPLAGISTKGAIIHLLNKLQLNENSVSQKTIRYLTHLIIFSLITEISYGFTPIKGRLNKTEKEILKLELEELKFIFEDESSPEFLNEKRKIIENLRGDGYKLWSSILGKNPNPSLEKLALIPYIAYYTPWKWLKTKLF